MTGWKLTRTCAVLWWIFACVYAVAEDWNTAITLVFTAAGWTGWAYEERKNAT
jgi:hypothetical protein